MCALYKRKVITKAFKLKRTNRVPEVPFCNSKCSVRMHNQRGDGGINCIDLCYLCYRLSEFDTSCEQYIKHKLRYIGM